MRPSPESATPDLRLHPDSPTEAERASALRRMKAVATGLLVVLAVIFTVAFLLQEQYPWLSYVRAAAEGGMVGALADWFAVTAIFRHPLGLKIPHTALIPRKKDTIGETLGDFVHQNFLEGEVVEEKLAGLALSERTGSWLRRKVNAERVAEEVATAAEGILDATDDGAVRDLITSLVQKHMVEPEWSPTLATVLENVVDQRHHVTVVDLLVRHTGDWVAMRPDFFVTTVRSRSPQWVPEALDNLLAERIHAELLKYLAEVRVDPDHELRRSIDQWLNTLIEDMRSDRDTRARVEALKTSLFNDPRLQDWAGRAWANAKATLLAQLKEPTSDLHRALVSALQDLGSRLEDDPRLARRVNDWAATAANHVLHRYGPELVGVIGETIQRWDGQQASRTIELYMGRDLQFIRINGSIVGALAGLAIHTIATLLLH